MTEEQSQHLTLEMISALLEEPERDLEAVAHLTECETCSQEHSRMRRMLMALSGLGELDPPAGEWERIEARLPKRRHVLPLRPARFFIGWPVQAAAAMLVFAGGIAAGLMLTGGLGRDVTSVASVDDLPYVGESVAEGPETGSPFMAGEYYEAVAGLDRLRARPATSEAILQDPVAAAKRLARLDALILASREALVTSPADPAINNLLFELIEERDRLAGGLEGAVQLAGLEYR